MSAKAKPIPAPIVAVFDKHGIPEGDRHDVLRQWRESSSYIRDALVAEHARGKDPKEKTGTVLAIVIDGVLIHAADHRKRFVRAAKARREHAKEFRTTFGVGLNEFWGALGFDIVAFDVKVVKSPKNVSCAAALQAKYGKRAVQIVRELMGGEA